MDDKFKIENIKIIIGLGNTGNEYLNTRHNAGFEFLDYIASGKRFVKDEKLKAFVTDIIVGENKIKLVKPITMMNYSGESFVLTVNYFKVEPREVLVVFDDLDLPLGEYRMHFGRGPKVHNGLLSVENRSKVKDFWRLRIGIDSRDEFTKSNMSGADFVLSKFKIKERDTLQQVFFNIVEKEL
jgi:PTH1 family peptidyl-tRNA hydrolase